MDNGESALKSLSRHFSPSPNKRRAKVRLFRSFFRQPNVGHRQ
jgi:hypothetical protein